MYACNKTIQQRNHTCSGSCFLKRLAWRVPSGHRTMMLTASASPGLGSTGSEAALRESSVCIATIVFLALLCNLHAGESVQARALSATRQLCLRDVPALQPWKPSAAE